MSIAITGRGGMVGKRIAAPILIIMLVGSLSGCATLGGMFSGSNTKTWGQLSPQEKSLYFLETYNMQFQDTMAMAKRPDLSDAQKQVVVTKKSLLVQLKPMITTYDLLAGAGGAPSQQDELAILALINQLLTGV